MSNRTSCLAASRAPIRIDEQLEDVDGKGVIKRFHVNGAAHVAHCRYRSPGRPERSDELAALMLDGVPLGEPDATF